MPLTIHTNRLSEWSVAPDDETLIVRAAEKALAAAGPRTGEVSVTFVSPDEIRALNRQFLGHDLPTDVIAFELGDVEILLGDVYICPDVARENAAERGEDLETELLRLVIHGALHVIGYDHPTGPEREASPMYLLQEELLRALADD